MRYQHPTPTCVRIKDAQIPCAYCGAIMVLKVLEPHKAKLDILTYHCVTCSRDETFIAATN